MTNKGDPVYFYYSQVGTSMGCVSPAPARPFLTLPELTEPS